MLRNQRGKTISTLVTGKEENRHEHFLYQRRAKILKFGMKQVKLVLNFWFGLILMPQSTAMVMSGWLVNLNRLFPGQA